MDFQIMLFTSDLLGPGKWSPFWQMTLSNEFSGTKMVEFRITHRSSINNKAALV